MGRVGSPRSRVVLLSCMLGSKGHLKFGGLTCGFSSTTKVFCRINIAHPCKREVIVGKVTGKRTFRSSA